MGKSIRILHLLPAAIAAVAVLIVAGCVKEMESPYNDGETITFAARMSEEATKASPVTQLSGEAGVIGYVFDTWTETLAPLTEFTEKTFEFDGDRLSQDGDPLKWNIVDKNRLRTYAYAPKTISGASVDHAAGTPTISYTVPTDVSEQTDIITAVNEVSKDFRQNIPLTFDHALTAIKFRAGFDCKVNSITISGVCDTGTFTMGGGWSGQSGTQTYTVTFDGGKTVAEGAMITDSNDGNVLFLIPQTFDGSSSAKITLKYDDDKTISTSLAGRTWEQGKMITYTLRQTDTTPYIYFDLAAGNVTINGANYSGSIYVAGAAKPVTGPHDDNNRYYVYQSSSATETEFEDFNRSNTGYASEADYNDRKNCRIPEYDPVMVGDVLWKDWIVDNTNVEQVIEIWDDGKYIRNDGQSAPDEQLVGTAVVRDVGRTHTQNYIKVTGQGTKINLTIDNIYSTIQVPVNMDSQNPFRGRQIGGISYMPSGNDEMTIHIKGDNRMGCLHIDNTPSDNIYIEGTGSLTAASTDFLTVSDVPGSHSDFGAPHGYTSNFWNTAIGTNTLNETTEPLYNLHINSGVIYAGTTAAEDCTAIGGGGNGYGQVFIHGGIVTAVATTAGTAIGGGMGHSAQGGPGEVHITGGNVYAYNFANQWNIPSSAIGGGGSYSAHASSGEVNISGGYIYAYSALGTAIGGGSSANITGGNATINISGGHIVAKSDHSSGIGGGTGGSNSGANGGTATITISGNPIIRTGSIGGGKTNNSVGTIGSADIKIYGGDIQAQFVMAAGAATKPKFFMNGGTIRNSYTDDPTYKHVETKGGAVYLEDGTVTIEGGTIKNCSAQAGGAIYIEGSATTSFTMSGGTIQDCISETDGGALYLEGGQVTLSGGTLQNNLAENGNGGAIYIEGGDFKMPDGGSATVTGNAAFNRTRGGNGGGIFVTSRTGDVNVDILSGKITDNSSDRYGGGISVDMEGYDSITANVTVGKAGNAEDNPEISANRTLLKGGGLFARGPKADITINSGKIQGNSTSGYVANADMANEGGMVTLNGGQVSYRTVTYNNNGDYYGDATVTREQKIVTATNSTMIAPTDFSKLGYILTGWNTRPDGKGTSYTDGQTLNISSDLTLYAQWTLN